MIFKIIAFVAAAIPIFLFVRSIFFRRSTRLNEGVKEFKKKSDLAVSIFLFLIGCVRDLRRWQAGLGVALNPCLAPWRVGRNSAALLL